MLLKRAAILFGIVFLIIGILGFVPGVTENEMLLGIFHVNAAHNAVHLLSGVVALACGMAGARASRLYFLIFGAVYLLVAILGLVQGEGHLLGLISNNMADVWLHFAIAIVSLFLAFAARAPADRSAPAVP